MNPIRHSIVRVGDKHPINGGRGVLDCIEDGAARGRGN